MANGRFDVGKLWTFSLLFSQEPYYVYSYVNYLLTKIILRSLACVNKFNVHWNNLFSVRKDKNTFQIPFNQFEF